jgi:ferredoxin
MHGRSRSRYRSVMAHTPDPDREYRLLQQRLDRHVIGAPESPILMKILGLLYSLEEARLARRLPSVPTSLNTLSRKVGIPQDELDDQLTEMSRRGVMMDLMHDGQRYFALPPVVIGFFEFTFMRARDDMPMAELARLFEEYFNGDDRFARSAFQGETQPGRRLIREEALLEEDHVEVLDWERASYIIQSAPVVSVSLCPCRHERSHLGEACDSPQETCLSLNYAAESLISTGTARRISTAEAMRILQSCKDMGLVQTADNVQRRVAYICNCCACCCGMIRALKTFNLPNAIASSNWIMEVDLSRCTGCGQCVEACPMDAVEIAEAGEGSEKRRWAVRDATLCLGCGVCTSACRTGAASMKPRARRVYTPETIFDQIASMAIERGKLADLIFYDPERLSHRALGRIAGLLEKSAPFKAAMAVKPLRSVFLNALVKGAKGMSGAIAEIVE